jgi:hypothetical protein
MLNTYDEEIQGLKAVVLAYRALVGLDSTTACDIRLIIPKQLLLEHDKEVIQAFANKVCK